MHETMDNDPKLRTMPKKDRKYALMNQRANSIADLAASIEIEVNKLKELADKAVKVAKKEEEVVELADANLIRQMKKKERKRGGVTLAEKAGVKEMELKEVLEGDIVVAWKDMLDAEFAQSWPARVIHRPMGELDRYSAPKPQVKIVVEEAPAEVVATA
ncbi:hypothetical protein EX30DRAFT_339598 [Ascodesmis nigricans]|uniref:Uncharacterized protein n=1 Tax=Ascodesmis nigricans TaxID=341454 RepID=A0A4S2N2R4_9PEZI|nr:hypothetical protein EX30DRAFT_339598 [Ascodesmis nigricans]